MKWRQLLLRLGCAAALCAGLLVPAAAADATFSDVPADHWAHAFVERASADGAVTGVGDGKFAPSGTLTIAQFLTIVTNAFYCDEVTATPATAVWYARYQTVAEAHGLLEGVDGAVTDPASRYEMASIMVRLLTDVGAQLPEAAALAQAEAAIPDWDAVPERFQTPVATVYAMGLISGTDSAGHFSGERTMTRAQATVVYTQLADTLAAQNITVSSPGSVGENVTTEGGGLTVHFLDVGQADSALVACDGHYMLIDGGNVADSSLVYSYLKAQGVDHLDYMVATHAHEDHVGGLAGALNYAAVDTALSPVTEYSTTAFQNVVKYLDKQGKRLTVPAAGDSFTLGSAQVEILGPVQSYSDTNNTSLVLRVDYGETSFLFTGDMEAEAEADLVEAGANLSATVLKVGHHGSDTSTSYRFLREVMPDYAVISVGTGNSYGHPTEAVLSRLRDAGAQVYRTDLQGTIVAHSDGATVTFQTEKTASQPTNPTAQPAVSGESVYIGNSGTMKFHRPSCTSVDKISQENRVELPSREAAVAAGYAACKNCKP